MNVVRFSESYPVRIGSAESLYVKDALKVLVEIRKKAGIQITIALGLKRHAPGPFKKTYTYKKKDDLIFIQSDVLSCFARFQERVIESAGVWIQFSEEERIRRDVIRTVREHIKRFVET